MPELRSGNFGTGESVSGSEGAALAAWRLGARQTGVQQLGARTHSRAARAGSAVHVMLQSEAGPIPTFPGPAVTHMPPELVSQGILSPATDAFSLGVLLLEMWHGRRAWLGYPPIRVLSSVAAGGCRSCSAACQPKCRTAASVLAPPCSSRRARERLCTFAV